MMDAEVASAVADMIESEIFGGYAYMSFEGMCREYGVTPKDFHEFIDMALERVEEKEDEE